MDWERLALVDLLQLERSETLLNSVYEFLETNELHSEQAAATEPAQLLRILSIVQQVMKVKGEEARVAMEELVARQQPEGEPPDEGVLMNQVVQLERELRERDRVLEGLRERGASPTPGAVNELRVLRQENEDLKHELGEVTRRLDHERAESDRLSGEAAAERLRARQLEREGDQLRNDLEEYRKHMENAGGGGEGSWGVAVGGASLVRAGEREYRERLRQKDIEIAEQLDKIEELLNVRDELEREREGLAVELGRAEEERIGCLREVGEMREALAVADTRCRERETASLLLEGQLADMRGCLEEKNRLERETHAVLTEKTKKWECAVEEKERELAEYRDLVHKLQSQLAEAAKDSNRATVIRLKKHLQDREEEVGELQEEMARGATALEQLSALLEEERLRTNSVAVSSALQKSLESAKRESEGLRQALEQEKERRRGCEVSVVERETELAEALKRLGEFEKGEYGLHEAIQEIKTRREEIAVRDRDIAELTQQVNQLDEEVNRLSELNEMLCERLGLGEGEEEEGFLEWRGRREGEREGLRQEITSLQSQLERLEEEKLALRKQLLAQRHTSSELTGREGGRASRAAGGKREEEREETDDALGDDPRMVIEQLRTQVAQLQRENVQMRRERGKLASRLAHDHRRQPSDNGSPRRTGGDERRGEGRERTAEELRSTRAELRSKCDQVDKLEKEIEILRQNVSGFQPIPLPAASIPMTSRDVISCLNEHLLCVLRAEKGRSQECQRMKSELERYQQKFSVLIHQQGLLYKEYLEREKGWEREKQKLIQEAREAEASKKSSLAMQLSRALTDLERKSETISDLCREAARTEEQANTLEHLLTESQRHLLEREREVAELRLAGGRREREERGERERLAAELAEADRQRRMAEENIRQLQALVSQKEKQGERYCQLLQEARSELRTMTKNHESEMASLVRKMQEQSDSTVRRLREVSMDTVAMPTVPMATEKELGRLRELEDLIGQQRATHEAQLSEVRRERERERREYETSLVRVRQEMGELRSGHFIETESLKAELARQSSRAVELEQEIQVMSGELSAVRETASERPSKVTQSLVERLRQQLSVKEKQQKALNEALRQLRSELLDTTQKAILSHTHQEVAEVNLQKRVQKRTSQLEDRVRELTVEVNGLRTELEQTRDRENEARTAAEEARERLGQLKRDWETEGQRVAEEARERMESEGERRGREEEKLRREREEERWRGEREEGREKARRLEEELQQCRRSIEQGRAREQKMTKELQILQQRSDRRPEVEGLERRLKVLQSRFDRQKQQLETLRHQQQKVVHVAVTPGRPPASGSDEAPPPPHIVSIRQTSSSSSAHSVLKWEETKRWQRKLDTLRTKLADKTKEIDSAQSHVTSLRETLERSEREKRFLQDRIKTLQKTVSNLEKVQRDAIKTGSGGGGFHGDGINGNHGDLIGGHTPSSEELQRVVSAMRKVIERLQKDNDKLKREALIRTRERAAKKPSQQEKEESEREGEGKKATGVAPPAPVVKLASENERLQKSLRREMERNQQLQLSLRTAHLERDRLESELMEQKEVVRPSTLDQSSSQEHEEEMEGLRVELEKKTRMLLEVKTHLKQLAEREKEREGEQELVTRERDELREQVKMLRTELNSFDPVFFEEVEDLKFNYQEAVKKNVQYEQQITSLSLQLGASPPSFTA